MADHSQHGGALPRFYTPDLSSDLVDLPAGEAHHARNVMRLKVGSAVELFDGLGTSAEASVTQVGRSGVSVSVTRRGEPRARPAPLVELAFAVPRGKRVDFLLEKATELGAAVLQPVIFERSVAGGESLSAGKRDRWMSHCVSAAKQCGLNFLPELCDPLPLGEFVGGCASRHKLVGDVEETTQPLATALSDWSCEDSVCVLVGPEGDLSPAEWPVVRGSGFVGVHLGHTTLRVETAGIALLAGVTAVCDGIGR